MHEVVPLAELAAAGEKVGQVLENGPEAIAETKAMTLKAASRSRRGAFEALIESHAEKRQSEEAAEGLASFAEKRSAKWTSRSNVRGQKTPGDPALHMLPVGGEVAAEPRREALFVAQDAAVKPNCARHEQNKRKPRPERDRETRA